MSCCPQSSFSLYRALLVLVIFLWCLSRQDQLLLHKFWEAKSGNVLGPLGSSLGPQWPLGLWLKVIPAVWLCTVAWAYLLTAKPTVPHDTSTPCRWKPYSLEGNIGREQVFHLEF